MKKTVLSFCFSLFFVTNAFAITAFPDISENYMYNEAVEYIKTNNIVEGYSDGTFKPYQAINRAELLKIIIESEFTNEEIATALDEYRAKNYWYADLKDVGINDWYAPYVRIAVREGIVQGYPDGTFQGAKNVNFVEALKMTMKAQGVSYNENTAPWYRGLVDKAATDNLVPLDITAFDLNITRGQMAELITRNKKKAEGTLDDYLLGASSVKQTYSNIANGVSQINRFINRNKGEENQNEEVAPDSRDDEDTTTPDTTETAEACGQEIIACGNYVLSEVIEDNPSLDCFIEAAKNCCSASIITETTLNIFGVDVTSETYREIQGMEGEQCLYYTRYDSYNYTLSDELASQLIESGSTQEDIDALLAEQEASSAELVGADGTCQYPINDLVKMLENEKEGHFEGFSEDIKKYECTGSAYDGYKAQ